MIERADVAALRLAAQLLIGPAAEDPTAAVRWLTAVQAQDHPGALTSVALRTRSRRRDAVEAALDAGRIVKSWPMRGTLHFVAAEDLPWMIRVLVPRVVTASVGRQAALGLDERQIELARGLAESALAGERSLSRGELFAVWQAGGVSPAEQRGVHLIRALAMTGTLVFGPTRDGEQLLVLSAEWLKPGPMIDRDEALGELALRYFRSHGPATVADFTRWAHLVAADVRAGLAIARPQLEAMTVNATEYLLDPATPERLAAARPQLKQILLLPGFDEFLLGYSDRRPQLPAEFADRIVPGGNGMFRPTVVRNGQVIGTWRRTGSGKRRTISVEGFEPLSARLGTEIAKRYVELPD